MALEIELELPSDSLDGRKLRPRERRIIAFIISERTNREIGKALGITEQSVKNYLRHIFDRVGCWSRLELAIWAVSNPEKWKEQRTWKTQTKQPST
jgi:DNA-binding CsgD family transcriptional regulator